MAILQECPKCLRRQAVSNEVCNLCRENLKPASAAGQVRYWISYRFPYGERRTELIGTSLEEALEGDHTRTNQKRQRRPFEIVQTNNATFNELAEWFISQKSVRALAYFVGLKAMLAMFNNTFGERVADKLMPMDIMNYQAELKAKGFSGAYIDKIIGSARQIVARAMDNGIINGDCLKPFRRRKRALKRGANARTMVLTYAEFKALHDKAPTHLRMVIALGYFGGMRRGEIIRLRWDQINLDERLIRLKAADTKEGNPKVVPINRSVRDELLAMMGSAATPMCSASGESQLPKHPDRYKSRLRSGRDRLRRQATQWLRVPRLAALPCNQRSSGGGSTESGNGHNGPFNRGRHERSV